MSNRELTHILNILKLLYDEVNLKVTSSDLRIANANQYLVPLEEMKLISRVSVPRENSCPFKVAFIDSTTRKKAKEYLEKYNMLNKDTPFHILHSLDVKYNSDEAKSSTS